MPAKTSKESSDRLKAARFVLSALFQHGQEISRLLVELFLPVQQEGDPEPEFFGTVTAIGRKLKVAIDQVIAADNRLFAANAALDAERLVRNQKASNLSRMVIGLRGACNSLFVDLPVQQLGFDARTAQDPAPLLIQADRVVESIEGGEVRSQPLFRKGGFDPREYAAEVRQGAVELRTCLDKMSDLQRDAEAALLHKREVTQEYDALFRDGARTFESYCRMAGKTELADRVRPSVKRPGRTEVPPGEAPEPTAGGEATGSAVGVSSVEEGAASEPAPANLEGDRVVCLGEGADAP